MPISAQARTSLLPGLISPRSMAASRRAAMRAAELV
jgi:hypothetical protein